MSVCKFERPDKILFGNLVRGSFNHDHVVLCADVNEVEVALFSLSVSRICDELAIHSTDANSANRPRKWNVGNSKGSRRAIDREDIRIVFAISTKENRNDLCIVKVTCRKKRPQWPVCHSGSERFLFRRTAFPFEVSTRELPYRRCFFAVIDGEREPILPFFDLRGGHRAGENDGLA